MGCDIHGFTEIKEKGGWKFLDHTAFDWRSYGVFGFLANVRNYSESICLSDQRGLPDDLSNDGKDASVNYDAHSYGFLTLKELIDFDYNKKFYDMRVTRNGNGAARAESLEEADYTTYRSFLREQFFKEIEILKEHGSPENVRIVFWFNC